MTIDYDKLLEDTESGLANAEANNRLREDGYAGTIDLTNAPVTASEVVAAEKPATQAQTFESKSRLERLMNSIEGGYHGLLKGQAASRALQSMVWAEEGYGALADDIDENVDDETRAQLEALLAKDTQANRDFKKKNADDAKAYVKEYVDLTAKDHLYVAPEAIQRAYAAAEGKGFWGGLGAALSEVANDPLNSLIYLGGTSVGAMAPYLALSAVTGGLGSVSAVRGLGAISGIRTAMTGAIIGAGSYTNEAGQYILDEMKRRGISPDDIESYRALYLNGYDEMRRKQGARSSVVAGFDALSGVVAVTRINPKEGYRAFRSAIADLSEAKPVKVQTPEHLSMVRRGMAKAEVPEAATPALPQKYGFNERLAGVGVKTGIDGVLGGAGEYLGSKAAGLDPNMADVLFEAFGELTSGPVEIASLSATHYVDHARDVAAAQTAKVTQDTLTKITQASEALAAQVQDKESLHQWSERVGQDKNLLAFAQDLVENGQVEEIRKTDPELAQKIDEAAAGKTTVEIPVAKIVDIAGQNRKLADDIIYDSRVDVDGMTPRQAEDFEKNGRAEAEKKFDQIIAKTSISKEHAREAREVSGELAQALIDEGMSETYAKTTAKIWNAYLVQRSRLLGVSPRAIAQAQGWRVKKHGGLKDQAENAKGSAVEQGGSEVDAGPKMPETVLIDGKEVAAKDSEGNYVGRNEQEVRAFYRWFNDERNDTGGVGQDLADRNVSGEASPQDLPLVREWSDTERKKGYRDGSKRIRFDQEGRPRVFFHGTTALFDTVQLGHKGQLDSGYMGRGFYVTGNPKQAKAYIERKKLSKKEDSAGEFLMGMYAKALNPVEISRELYAEMHSANADMMSVASDHLRKKFIEAGYDSAYIVQYDGGEPFVELVVFDPNQVKAARSMQDERGQPNGTYDPNDDNMFHQPLSSRYPTAARKTEDGDTQMLYADYNAAKSDSAFMEKNAPLLKTIPGMATKKRKPEVVAEECIEKAKANLLFLFDMVPEETRKRAKLWYDGGRRMSEVWAKRYGIAPQTAAAVIAVLSPQKGWFENVSMGERILDAMFAKRDFVWDEAMTKKANAIANKPELKEDRARAEGKSLGELLANNDYIAAAIWIRCYDQAHNDSAYKILSPEGGAQDFARTDSGKKSSLRWQNYGAIAKAISCIEDPRPANISLQLGNKHKVRNFYNNIAHPELPFYATIDTHAVAAATLIPLAASDVIVDQNFGGKGTKSSAASGLSGTYPYFFEAYKRAAAERGVLPREMQSITWEAIRAIYTDRFKTEANKQAVVDVWKAVDADKMSVDEARAKVVEMAGGLKKFAWEEKPYDEAVGDTYDRAGVNAQIDVGTGSVNFEVAPDPNNVELTARWNELPKEEKIRISATVAREMVQKVLAEFEAEGTLTEQVGGYLGETNPSFVLEVTKGPQAMPIAKMLGYVLNQDSMMVTTSKPEVGTGETGSVAITLPEGYSYSQISALYSKLWELKGANGESLCGGFSARGNTMTILNFTEYDDAWLADKIKDAVEGFNVATETLNVGFPDRKEGDYSYEGDSRANILRDQATQSLYRELDLAAGQGVSALASGSAGRVNPGNSGEQSGDFEGVQGQGSSEASSLAGSGSGTQDGRDPRSEGRVQQSGTSAAGDPALVKLDADYFDAIERGDMDAVRAMVEDRAKEMGFEDAIPEQTDGYTVRIKPAPKKTVKAYKIFYVDPKTGQPSTLFVGGAHPIPQNMWLNANEAFSIVSPKNGRRYVPTFSNPNRSELDGKKKTQKTGETIPIVDPEVKAELIKRGFVTEKAKSVTGVAFRPGWHAGTLPYFPQGGKKKEGSNYGNVHEWNQVVYEIEVAADKDYTEIARSQEKAKTKSGKVNARMADLDYLPKDGMYFYTTNPMLNPSEDGWVISESIKIVRALTQEECDTILQKAGKKPQEWEQGQFKLEDVGITDPEHSDVARKTLAPITYDANGNIIPLSQRFDASKDDVLYQSAMDSDFTPDQDLIERAVENFGTTKNTKEAFYILPDGRMLDGSGRHWGADERDIAGQRQVDHQDITEVIDDYDRPSDAMYKWMARTGAMRFDQIVGIASVARKPTPEQLAILKKTSKGKYLALSLQTPEGRIVDDTEFDRASPDQIDNFFNEALEKAVQGVQGAFAQNVRGAYNPTNVSNPNGKAGMIELMQSSDRSTFLHESAHAWLDADTRLAMAIVEKHQKGIELTEGEKAFIKNLGAFFQWGQREGVLNLNVGEDLDSICAAVDAWSRMNVKAQKGMHELFAEGFESYLMGGEAPASNLIPIFQQFAHWLKAVYAQLASTPHPISPEVRKLYDQLFVSEQESTDAEVRAGMSKLFTEADTDMMSETERAEYDRLNEQASMETRGLVARALSGVMRVYAKIRDKTMAEMMKMHGDRVKLVEADLMKEPRHIARKILTEGYVTKEGQTLSTKLSAQALRDAGFDTKTISLLKRRKLVDEAGVTPEMLASMCGHKNALELIGELLETRDVTREACEIVAAQVREETGMGVDAYSAYRADLAAHNATRSRVLTIEHNLIARKLGKRQLLVGAARQYALNKIAGMKISEITPTIYQRDEKRCAREAEKAFRAGDFDRALEMKRAQIINSEMARAALEVQDTLAKGQRRLKRAMKSKGLYPAYQQLLCFVAKRHGINGRKAVKEVDEATAVKIAASLETDGTPVDGITPSAESIPTLLLEKDVDSMTGGEVKDLFEAVQQLEKLARDRLTIIKDGIKQKTQDLIDEGTDTLEANAHKRGQMPMLDQRIPLTRKEKAFDKLQRFFYAHIKIATWCRIFDGLKEGGFWTKNFIETANKCADWEEEQRVRVAERVRDIMRPVFKNHRVFESDKVRIGRCMMSKGERIAAALNMGNWSNFQRLRDGDPSQWTGEAIKALQESLTVDDWRAVQMIWDLFESFRPLISEKETRVYGSEPEWIEIDEIEVYAKGGQKIKLKGGYYPVVYDPRASNIADVHQEAAAIEQSMKGAWQSATTRRSFTKSRVQEVHDRPLRLDLSALYSGLDDVIHDLAWHEWLIDTHRLLEGTSRDNGLRAVIKDYYGYHVAKSFEEWRKAIALGDRAEMDGTTREIFRWLGGNVGLAAMGFSFTSALSQITGLGYVVPRCGTIHTMAALREALSSPKNLRKAIDMRSTLMRNRRINATKQVSDIRNVLEKGKENVIKKYAYSMLLAVQSFVDEVAWQAGYRKALSEGKNEADAVKAADQVVIDTQSSGRINDLSAVERNEYLAPFTVFYSWANAALNMSYAVAKGEISKPKRLAQLFYMGVLMPIIDSLVRDCMKIDAGDDDDDDDEKDLIDYLLLMPASKALEYHAGLFVGTREIANAAGAVVSGETVWKYGGPAGVRGISTMIDLGAAVQDPLSWHSLNTFIDTAGLLGLPATQTKKTIKGIRAIASDQVEGFDAMLAPFFGFSGKIEE